MTKEQLLKENRELKNEIIELQAQIIRLRYVPMEIKVIEREIIKEKPDVSPYLPYHEPTTGDPLPPPTNFTICYQ